MSRSVCVSVKRSILVDDRRGSQPSWRPEVNLLSLLSRGSLMRLFYLSVVPVGDLRGIPAALGEVNRAVCMCERVWRPSRSARRRSDSNKGKDHQSQYNSNQSGSSRDRRHALLSSLLLFQLTDKIFSDESIQLGASDKATRGSERVHFE